MNENDTFASQKALCVVALFTAMCQINLHVQLQPSKFPQSGGWYHHSKKGPTFPHYTFCTPFQPTKELDKDS